MYQKTQDGSFIIAGTIGSIEHKKVGEKQSDLTKFGVKVGEKPSAVDGEEPEAVWTNCDAWNKLSRMMQDIGVSKGDGVFCAGKLQTREHDGKTYKTLRCDVVIPACIQKQQQSAQKAPEIGDLSEFEEIIGDGDAPF